MEADEPNYGSGDRVGRTSDQIVELITSPEELAVTVGRVNGAAHLQIQISTPGWKEESQGTCADS